MNQHYFVFHDTCPHAVRTEICDRFAQSLSPNGDPHGERLLEMMMLGLDASNDAIFDRPTLNSFLANWGKKHDEWLKRQGL